MVDVLLFIQISCSLFLWLCR